MEELKWIREEHRLFSWNECPVCGYKSYDTIFGEQVRPDECPECGTAIYKEEVMKPGRYKPSWYRNANGCRAYHCQFGLPAPERCCMCGFNEEEHCRRLNLPWVEDENGCLHKDISMIKMEDRV